MKGRGSALAVCAFLAVGGAQAVAQTPLLGAAAPQYVTYSEEAPCPPTAAAPARARVHRARRRVRRAKPHLHVALARPVVRRLPVRHVVRRPRPHFVRASVPVHTQRCSVLRRERLTPASFGLTPDTAVLQPVADDVVPGGPNVAAPSSGRAAIGDPVNPSTGGGDPTGGGGDVVGAAPEPAQWLLLCVGVGGIGAALRRRPRPVAVS